MKKIPPLQIAIDDGPPLTWEELKAQEGPLDYNFRMNLLDLNPGEGLALGPRTFRRVDDPPTRQGDYSGHPGKTKSGAEIKIEGEGRFAKQAVDPGDLLAGEGVWKKIRQAGEAFDEMQKDQRSE